MDRNRIGRYLLILLAAVFPAGLAAQNSVTPIIQPTPAGQLITLNNGPGVHSDPHVSGDLVCYSEETNPETPNYVFTVHYFNLVTGLDATVPPGPALTDDFLCDVRGSTVAFTRIFANGNESILTFDTANASAPVSISPLPSAADDEPAIGDQAIIWQDFAPSFAASTIVAYNRATGATQPLSSGAFLDETPAISADGTVAVWSSCVSASTCNTWKAILANGTWSPQQLGSQVQGIQSHPDTDGATIVYSSRFVFNGVPKDGLLWQAVSRGAEQILNLPGSSITPSISGGLIAFAHEVPGGSTRDLVLYDVNRNVLYNLTADLAAAGLYPSGVNNEVSDISVTPDGKVRVVWQEIDFRIGTLRQSYAYTFNLATADLAIRNLTFQRTVESGEDLLYILEVQNLGPQASSNVVVSDPLPTGTSFVAAFPTQGVCTAPTPANAGTVSCNLGNLAKGAFAFVGIAIKATASSGTSITNTVAVNGANFDANTANNSVAIVTPVVADNDRQHD